MKTTRRLLTQVTMLALTMLLAMPAMAQTASKIAFPGAEGFGRYATGGRGGKVYHVTNLDDSGTGSLRWALGQSGKKIIVFDVSGTIHLESALSIASNTTVAGQTAPGDGICVADYPCAIKGSNVIVRYMRFRLGNKNVTKDGADGWDGFGSLDCNNFIIDHCSVSWSIDECLSVSGCKNITVQWCLVAQSLVNSGHSKGDHGYGGNWGGAGSSYHHNLMVHHTSRTPRLGPRPTTQLDERMDMRNNVIYNWAGNGCYGGEGMKVNIVNNYYKPGPGTLERNTNIQKRIAGVGIRTTQYVTTYPSYKDAWHIWGKFYVTGNVNSMYNDVTKDNWTNGFYNQIDASGNDGTYTAVTKDTIKIESPIEFPATTTHSAEVAYEKVLKYVGASLHRDSHDELMVSDTRDGKATYTGAGCNKGCINSQDDNKPAGAGADWSAWPTLNSTEAPADTDGDGMPDAWETANGLNPSDASDGSQVAENGYTNVENYLNSLVADITEAQNADGTLMGVGGMQDATFTLSSETLDRENSQQKSEWKFTNGFTVTGDINYGSGTYNAVEGFYPFQVVAGKQHTIHLPEGVSVTAITFTGYSNSTSRGELSEVNGETQSECYFPARTLGQTSSYTVTFPKAVSGDITFTVKTSAVCMALTLKGVKQGEDDEPQTNPGDDEEVLESIGTGTITWVFDQGTASQAGTVSDNIAAYITADNTTVGKTLEIGKKTQNGTNFTQFTPSIAKEASGNADNAVTFSINTKEGYYFQPTSISFYCSRFGTDGGKMDIRWVSSYGESLLEEGMVPERDTNSYQYSILTDDQPATTGTMSLVTNIYALSAKSAGMRDVVITGEVKASPAGIHTVTVSQRPTDGYFYNMQGMRVEQPQHGIYIFNGRKVVVK